MLVLIVLCALFLLYLNLEAFWLFGLVVAGFPLLVQFAGYLPDALLDATKYESFRRLYDKRINSLLHAASSRPAVYVTTYLIFAFLIFQAGSAGFCLIQSARHKSAIEKWFATKDYDNDDALISFFKLAPWRHENMYAFELRARQVGAGDRDAFREFVDRFVHDKTIEEKFARLKSGSYWCQCEDDDTLIDPYLWYVSILPEAEENADAKMKQIASSMLSDDSDLQSLFSAVIKADLSEKDGDTAKQLAHVATLETLSSQLSVSRSTSEILQVAYDTIAQTKVKRCNVDEAISYYEKLLSRRKATAEAGSGVIWIRPPHKLTAYFIFRILNGDRSMSAGTRAMIDDLLSKCDGAFESRFRSDLFDNPTFESFRVHDTWVKGSPSEIGANHLELILTDYAQTKWRYWQWLR